MLYVNLDSLYNRHLLMCYKILNRQVDVDRPMSIFTRITNVVARDNDAKLYKTTVLTVQTVSKV